MVAILPGHLDELFRKLFGMDVKAAFTGYQKQVGEDKRSAFSRFFSGKQSRNLVVIAPVLVGTDAIPAIVKALSAETLIGKAGTEQDVQGLMNPSNASFEKLAKFNGYIPPDDYRAMRLAYLIIDQEDNGLIERASITTAKLAKRYKERGRHIYNLCRSGLIDWLEIRLDHLRFMFEAPAKRRQDFAVDWEKWMAYCKIAVFTNSTWTRERLMDEMSARMFNFEMPEVMAFARGRENIQNLKSWGQALCEKYPGWRISGNETYAIGSHRGVQLRFEPIPRGQRLQGVRM